MTRPSDRCVRQQCPLHGPGDRSTLREQRSEEASGFDVVNAIGVPDGVNTKPSISISVNYQLNYLGTWVAGVGLPLRSAAAHRENMARRVRRTVPSAAAGCDRDARLKLGNAPASRMSSSLKVLGTVPVPSARPYSSRSRDAFPHAEREEYVLRRPSGEKQRVRATFSPLPPGEGQGVRAARSWLRAFCFSLHAERSSASRFFALVPF